MLMYDAELMAFVRKEQQSLLKNNDGGISGE